MSRSLTDRIQAIRDRATAARAVGPALNIACGRNNQIAETTWKHAADVEPLLKAVEATLNIIDESHKGQPLEVHALRARIRKIIERETP